MKSKVDLIVLLELKNGNTDINKYKYSWYGLGFSTKKYLHKVSGKNADDLIIFGVDLSDSIHAENKKNNILVLGKKSAKLKRYHYSNRK